MKYLKLISAILPLISGFAYAENLRIAFPDKSSQIILLSGVWCHSGDPTSKSYSLVNKTTPPTYTKLGCYQTDDTKQLLVLMPTNGGIKKVPYSKVNVIDNVSGNAAYTAEFLTQSDRDLLSRKQSLAFQKPLALEANQTKSNGVEESQQASSPFAEKCMGYGFQLGTTQFSQCLQQAEAQNNQAAYQQSIQQQQLFNNAQQLLRGDGGGQANCFQTPGVPGSVYCR